MHGWVFGPPGGNPEAQSSLSFSLSYAPTSPLHFTTFHYLKYISPFTPFIQPQTQSLMLQ
jgi:hypothetical protein